MSPSEEILHEEDLEPQEVRPKALVTEAEFWDALDRKGVFTSDFKATDKVKPGDKLIMVFRGEFFARIIHVTDVQGSSLVGTTQLAKGLPVDEGEVNFEKAQQFISPTIDALNVLCNTISNISRVKTNS